MKRFKGVFTALITPLKNNRIDETSLRRLVDWQIESGIHGLVPCGTTGESATLSPDEKKAVIKIVIGQANKRVPVIAGTGTNNTAESILLTRWAKEAGANGALIVTPYYNKPSPEGLYRHYKELANIGIPIVLYNVPGRTALSLSVETIHRLSQHPNIVALKEATASMTFASEILLSCGSKITMISGDDFTFLPFLSLGGEGVISVVSNVVPREFSSLYESFQKGDLNQSRSIHFRLYPLMQDLFIETSPVPVKTALSMMKKITPEFRLPLCKMKKENQTKLEKTLKNSNVI